MANNTLLNDSVPSVNLGKYPQPELSDEPILNNKALEYNSQGKTAELNCSSLQISTQHSLYMKKSFSISSPRQSLPKTPRFLRNDPKFELKKGEGLRLSEKLKLLEDENRKNTEKSELETEKETEMALAIEDEENFEIPHLRWCAFCTGEVVTEVEYVNNDKTFWASLGIFFAGGVFGCFMLPYMLNFCKGVKLICHKCKRPIG